jgi:hypothetical protein
MLVGGEANVSLRLTLTSLNSECMAKESQLTGVMWYKDTPGQHDKRTTDNKGFTARTKLTTLIKSVQMMGKLHLDLFCQDKYLLNHHVTHYSGETQLHLSDIQSHFLDLDLIIGRVGHESKTVQSSSQFNFQIHVVEKVFVLTKQIQM